MNELFYATVKMTTGEEVLAEVMLCEENDTQFFIFYNPIVMEENFEHDQGKFKYVPSAKKWLQFATDDMVVVQKSSVITISEMDRYGAEKYLKYAMIARMRSPVKREMKTNNHTGYLGSIDKLRKDLEDMYNRSHDIPD